MQTDAFSPHMEAVARDTWGEPNKRLCSATELRWGTHGSKSVDLVKGVWFDNEDKVGGGVLDFLRREKRLVNGEALDHLREVYGAEVGTPRPTGAIGRALFGAPSARRATIETPSEPEPAKPRPFGKVVAEYDYIDEQGEVLFQAVRLEPKEFRQRRPATQADRDADTARPAGSKAKVKGDWVWSIAGVRQVPYRLQDIYELEGRGRIYVCEGEKDADKLAALGLTATCNAMGAGKWPAELNDHFSGLDVVVLPDNDEPGELHANLVASSLKAIAKSVRVVRLPALPPKGDVSDWLEAGGTNEALDDLATREPPWTPPPPASRFGAVPWTQIAFLARRTDHLVKGLMFRGDVGMVYGESRAGKSFLNIDLNLCVARGLPFFGMRTTRAAVAYQAGEGATGVVSRLKAYGIEHGVAAANIPFVLLKSRIDLYSRDGDVDAFIAELLQWQSWLGEPFGIVNIDTFSAATPGANENASEDVSRVLLNGHRIKEATGAAVNFVHHKNAGGTKARGHTSIFADADFALDVVRDDETNDRTFKLAKVKDGEDGKLHGFRLQPVHIGIDDDGDPITSCVVRPVEIAERQAGQRNGQKASPTAHVLFIRTLKAVLRQQGHYAPEGVPVPNRACKVVEWDVFRDAMKATADPDTNDAAFRQQLRRVGNELLSQDRIGRHEPFLWITTKGEFGS